MNVQSVAVSVVVALCVLAAGISSSLGAEGGADGDIERIREIHEKLLESHLRRDAGGVLGAEADGIIVVSGGEVHFPTREERVSLFERYLGGTEFTEYADLIDPIVRVSDDGTLGWLIAQVRIAGTHTNSVGEKRPVDSIWAWIELYEKRDGRWFRVGEVSNVKSLEQQ